jgi:hypothetical protein
MIEDDLEGIADAPELPTIAADVVKDGLLHLWVRGLSEVDIDKAETGPRLIERQGIDGLCCGASDSWKLLGIMFPPIVMKIK